MFKYFLIILGLISITACGGGGSSDPSTNTNTSNTNNQVTFTDWTGSANGTYVIDATDDLFQFEYTSGLMHFGNTTITNVWVDASANLYFNSQIIGAVTYVKATNGSTITGLISNSGLYIDFYGPESSLTWQVSSKNPVFAKASFNKSRNSISLKALESNNKNSGSIDYEQSIPNAIIENRPLNSEGYATEGNK